ncbi:YaaL family protein [Savagea sp. SN6]|uniref:YaaL family protein n=1 Tax=Savagea serpentis TaxID=2785297 RepID=A0A8J7GKC0_9BACL|nr:YaaL family protein [Savagea serpentis]MBF4501575.1 YaaL family protein [Savagea serpentis]
MFRLFRKHSVRQEFDDRFMELLQELKEEWEQARELEELVRDYDEHVIAKRKIAESKYFYMFKEARERNIRLNRRF